MKRKFLKFPQFKKDATPKIKASRKMSNDYAFYLNGGGYKATHMEEALKSYVDPTTHSVDVNPPLSSALQEQTHE